MTGYIFMLDLVIKFVTKSTGRSIMHVYTHILFRFTIAPLQDLAGLNTLNNLTNWSLN